MAINHLKRSLEILQEEGCKTLISSGASLAKTRLGLRYSPFMIRKKRYITHKRNGHTAIPDPFNKLCVSPKNINLYRSRRYSSAEEYWGVKGYWAADKSNTFDKWSDLGEIYDGEWDKKTLDLTQLPKYVGMKEHFTQEIPWKETTLFSYYRSILDKGIRVDGCKSESELLNRYKRIEKMCDEIRLEGYKSREEVCDVQTTRCLMDEVTISIGREGQLIFGDGGGWHRLSAAKMFDIDTIPVRVLVRHVEWQELRDEIHNNGLPEGREEILHHPDIQDVLKA